MRLEDNKLPSWPDYNCFYFYTFNDACIKFELRNRPGRNCIDLLF